ncbi:MAG: transcriptional repressor NrdR [Pirellulaceae bacterium]|nr:MAG: transcriptional repressor NrdR [Pirellulaceae bacterium]GIW91077.1 MAG: transcriptional repressor NrdR [Pirellulaceae bacterium]GIW96217.1 MAG: transcriptional repressor NrdR [Pirellulaceae bacterium]
MRCPNCGMDNDRVVDTRSSEDGFAVRRRRVCQSCHHRYTTYERLEPTVLQVIKKSGAREPFNPDKLRRGLQIACGKRPVSTAEIDQIVSDITDVLYRNFDGEVPSRMIGDLVMERLREVDQVAYVRFASVYREFKDVRDFVSEVEPMLQVDAD